MPGGYTGIINNMDEVDASFSGEFLPIDFEQMRLIRNLPPHKRVRAMLDGRELVRGLIRGRLRKQYPEFSDSELNMKLLMAVTRVR